MARLASSLQRAASPDSITLGGLKSEITKWRHAVEGDQRCGQEGRHCAGSGTPQPPAFIPYTRPQPQAIAASPAPDVRDSTLQTLITLSSPAPSAYSHQRSLSFCTAVNFLPQRVAVMCWQKRAQPHRASHHRSYC